MSEGTLKTYCWMYSSFNIPAAYEGKCARKRQSEDVMYNSYYQWVSLCLVGQVTHSANRNYSVFNAETALTGKIDVVAGDNFVFLIFRLSFSTYPEQFGCPWRVCIGLIYDTISSDKSHLRGLNEASGQGQGRQGGGGCGGQM